MATAGETLRLARESRGYTIEEIEEKLNIRSKYIFALEEEDFDALPGKAYVTGYVKNYARFLNLDPEAIAAEVKGKLDTIDAMAITTIELSPLPEEETPAVSIEQEILAPKVSQSAKIAREERKRNRKSKQRDKNVHANFGILYFMLALLLLMGLLAFIGTRNWGI